jgi:hypothetical protein
VYGTQADPRLTFFTDGDVLNAQGEVLYNTVLVENDGVQDRLEILIERAPGKKVIYTETGAIGGYVITCRLADASPNNQNDRYNVSFITGTFRITPIQVNGNVSFSGYTGLYDDGSGRPKNISAYYSVGNGSQLIAAEDLIYKRGDEELDGAPSERGSYTVEVNSNYNVTGNKKQAYTIQ